MDAEQYQRTTDDHELLFIHQEDGSFELHIDSKGECLDVGNVELFIQELTLKLGEVKAEAAAARAHAQVRRDRTARLAELRELKTQSEKEGKEFPEAAVAELDHLAELESNNEL